MFNQGLLSDLLIKSQGSRSLSKFAKQCGLSTGNLSRIRNCKITRPPQPDTLQKIAMHSNGEVSYEELLNVCNYIGDDFRLSDAERFDVAQTIKELEVKLTTTSNTVTLANDVLCPEAVESLLKALAFGVEQAALINKLSKK